MYMPDVRGKQKEVEAGSTGPRGVDLGSAMLPYRIAARAGIPLEGQELYGPKKPPPLPPKLAEIESRHARGSLLAGDYKAVAPDLAYVQGGVVLGGLLMALPSIFSANTALKTRSGDLDLEAARIGG